MGTVERIQGETEVDETFIGGKAKNMHAHKRAAKIKTTGPADKAVVVGAKNRDTGQVVAEVVPDRTKASLLPFVTRNVERGGTVYTDRHQSYNDLYLMEYRHESVDHAVEYVTEGRVHTNGLENFWSLLKRGLGGTYVSVAPEHLSRYVDERVFTYNLRHLTDLERFRAALTRIAGRRLTYAELTS
jgi:transposase-like protein